MVLLRAAVAALVSVTISAEPAETGAPTIPPGLLAAIAVIAGDDGQAIPLDADGLPSRALSDAELFRVLVQVSQVLDAAGLRLARCHALGDGFGTPSWRACIEER
jgi:hypothetical protein